MAEQLVMRVDADTAQGVRAYLKLEDAEKRAKLEAMKLSVETQRAETALAKAATTGERAGRQMTTAMKDMKKAGEDGKKAWEGMNTAAAGVTGAVAGIGAALAGVATQLDEVSKKVNSFQKSTEGFTLAMDPKELAQHKAYIQEKAVPMGQYKDEATAAASTNVFGLLKSVNLDDIEKTKADYEAALEHARAGVDIMDAKELIKAGRGRGIEGRKVLAANWNIAEASDLDPKDFAKVAGAVTDYATPTEGLAVAGGLSSQGVVMSSLFDATKTVKQALSNEDVVKKFGLQDGQTQSDQLLSIRNQIWGESEGDMGKFSKSLEQTELQKTYGLDETKSLYLGKALRAADRIETFQQGGDAADPFNAKLDVEDHMAVDAQYKQAKDTEVFQSKRFAHTQDPNRVENKLAAASLRRQQEQVARNPNMPSMFVSEEGGISGIGKIPMALYGMGERAPGGPLGRSWSETLPGLSGGTPSADVKNWEGGNGTMTSPEAPAQSNLFIQDINGAIQELIGALRENSTKTAENSTKTAEKPEKPTTPTTPQPVRNSGNL